MKNWIFTLILALQGMVLSYAQSEAFFALWDADQKHSLEANYSKNMGLTL